MKVSSVSTRSRADVFVVNHTCPAEGTQPVRVSQGKEEKLLFSLVGKGERGLQAS